MAVMDDIRAVNAFGTAQGKLSELLRPSFFDPPLMCLATGLIAGFAVLQWGAGSGINLPDSPVRFSTDFYFSGTTFFTLGLGDITLGTPISRIFTAVESGVWFGFLALVIGYLPLLNQSFSRREVNLSLLDARAGSPPTASEMVRRHDLDHGMESLRQLLSDWERWSAEFLEIHLSYPVLAYFRSRHDNQSWLTCLTTIMDASALVIAGIEDTGMPQAQLTFAIARHAVVDLSQVFLCAPGKPEYDRLPPSHLAHLREFLTANGLRLKQGSAVDQRLVEMRHLDAGSSPA
jgi:hypothetical protein